MPVTTAAAWRQAAHKVRRLAAAALELPSGAVVLATRPPIETWLVRGRMPEALASIVLALSGEESARRNLTAEEIAELGRFNRSIIEAAVVEPRIVDGEPGEGEIGFGEIPDADLDFILAWARRAPEVAQLDSFRQRPGLSAAGDNGSDVRPAAEQPAGAGGPGAGA